MKIRIWPWSKFNSLERQIQKERASFDLLTVQYDELRRHNEETHSKLKECLDSHTNIESSMRKLTTIMAMKHGILVLMMFLSFACFGQPVKRNNITTNDLPTTLTPWTNDVAQGLIPSFGTNPPISGVSSITFPFPGYATAAATGTNAIKQFLGNTNTSQFPYTALSYINTTNADGSILMDIVQGYNMDPGAGVILQGQPQLGQQLEYHWPQVGKGLVEERHDIFSPTNGIKQRYFDAQFVETNGYTGLALSFDYLAFAPHTNSTAPAIQMNMGWISGIPTITEVRYNGSFFYWPYPEGAGILAQAEDSTSTAHSIWSWSPTCGGTGCLFVSPNGDIASVQQNCPFYLLNQPFGLAGNSGLSPAYIQVNGRIMTATGGITAGGTSDPGAGNSFATNRLDAPLISLPTNYVAAAWVPIAGHGFFVMSNNACYFVTNTKTNLIAGP